MAGMVPIKGGHSRVFLIEGRARADHPPDFKSCLAAGAPSWSFGDVESIECPDPDQHNSWVEVGEIQAASDRPTIGLTGHYALDEESDLLRIARTKCAIDVQVHFGVCTNPSDFLEFTKIDIYEQARISDWSTGDQGALQSGDNTPVDETANLSAKSIYSALPLGVAERGGDAVVNPIVDVVICDTASCGDCEDESDGCEKVYAVDDGNTGSPGTRPDVLYSTDKASAWGAEEITSLESGAAMANAIACLGLYLFVVSQADCSIHYKLKADVGDGGPYTETVVGLTCAAGAPRDAWSVGTYAFIVGDAGYIYGSSDITAGVSELDAGVASDTDILHAVHALDDQFAVAVGENGKVVFTTNQSTWTATTTLAGAATNQAVWAMNETDWWVGDAAGVLRYTLDQGVTWTVKALPGANWTAITDIQFPTASIGFITASKAATGHMLRTFDGGYQWVEIPESVGVLPGTTAMTALASCKHDVNFVVGVGTDGTDGVIIVGQD